MQNKKGLYLMRYNNIVNNKKYDIGKIGFKFGRTNNIKKRLEFYKKNKKVKYNLIKFFPCNNEKLREQMILAEINFNRDFYSKSEHIEKCNLTVKEIIKKISFYANGKLKKDFKSYFNYIIEQR